MIPAAVIVEAGGRALARSTRPAALERFAGAPLIEHTVELARSFGAPIYLIAPERYQPESASLGELRWIAGDADDDPGAAVERAGGELPAAGLALWLGGERPLVTADTARRVLLAAATAGAEASGGARSDPAGIAAIDLRHGAQHPVAGAAVTVAADPVELTRITDKPTLVRLERLHFERRARALLAAGLLIRDPARIDLYGAIEFDDDVEIAPDVTLHGPLVLGRGVRIGAGCIIRDAVIGPGTEIRPLSMVEGARIGERCTIGPYARIRPQTVIEDAVSIGNYVEIKQSNVGRKGRINHLAFVGDAMLEDQVTIGAGVITCNHDGATHQRTVIRAGAYVGSGSQLIAPIEIGAGATIGSGSTVTRDAPAGQLTLARSRQVVVEGWTGPRSRRRP